MLTEPYVFEAGERKTLPAGSFFMFMEGAGALDLYFKKGGQIIGKAIGAKSGFSQNFGIMRTGNGFDSVEVVSATAQTVVICIADDVGGYQRFSGSVEFPSAQPVTVENAPEVASGASHHSSVGNSSVLQTIVAPAANVNGVKIHLVQLSSNDAACRLCSKSSAPSSYADTSARSLALSLGSAVVIEKPFMVPAGEGLYFFPTAGLNSLSVFYEVL